MEPIETYEYKGCQIEIYQDCDPVDPREWDNFSHIWCWHRRYNLGDSNELDSGLFSSWGAVEEHLVNEENAVEIISLYLLDHSGLALRAGRGFSDCDPHGWDWGQVGFAFAAAGDVEREYGEVTDETLALARKLLGAEVDTYCDYIQGNVFGYHTIDRYGEVLDSCWGFIGDEWKEDSYMVREAKGVIDAVEIKYEEYIERLRGIAATY